MASTVTNSFDAERLHQPIVVAVSSVPRIPLWKNGGKFDHLLVAIKCQVLSSHTRNSEFTGFKQYLNFLSENSSTLLPSVAHTCILGGAVALCLVRSSLDRAVWVQALAGDIVLCSWARHFILTGPLSTHVYKWVPANLMLGVTLQWTNIPSRGEWKYS